MLLVLPPSEGKTPPPDDGPALDLGALAHPGLRATRERVLDALVDLCSGDPGIARETLGLGVTGAGEVDRDRALRDAPCGPAARVYTGVLFGRLGLDDLPPGARARAAEQVLVVSALWGVVRPGDPIPAYRLSAGTALPGLPTLAAVWREPLREALPDDAFVVDLRSGGYKALWRPPGASVAVGAVEVRNGERRVVSHMAKAVRGDVGRALLKHRGKAPADARGVARILGRAGFEVELGDEGRDGVTPLTVVERPE